MTIGTRAELIKQLKKGNPNEELVWTYWGASDFEGYKDKDQAYSLVEEALDNAIGEVNNWLESQYEESEDED